MVATKDYIAAFFGHYLLLSKLFRTSSTHIMYEMIRKQGIGVLDAQENTVATATSHSHTLFKLTCCDSFISSVA